MANVDYKTALQNKKSYLSKGSRAAEKREKNETVEGIVTGFVEQAMEKTDFREAGKALYMKVTIEGEAQPVRSRVPDPDTQLDLLPIGAKIVLIVDSFEKVTKDKETGEEKKEDQKFFAFHGWATDSAATTVPDKSKTEKAGKQ